MPKPGVTDPEAESALALLRRPRLRRVATSARSGPTGSRARPTRLPRLIERVLANDAVEQAVVGALAVRPARPGAALSIPADRGADPRARRPGAAGPEPDRAARAESRRDEGDPAPFRRARPRPDRLRARDARPDLERALLAQDAAGTDRLSRAGRSTTCSRKRSSARPTSWSCDWLVSVFSDNAGVVRFDDDHDVCFKVETHNHPSAIDPYGGANTGLGRRDPRRARDRAGGQADLQHRRLLRGVARPGAGAGSPRACFTPSACSRGSSPASAITATAWASPRSTAPWPSIRATWPIPWSSAAPSASCRGAWQRSASSRATGSSPSAVAPAATASTARPSARPS